MKNFNLFVLSILIFSASAFAVVFDGMNITGNFANATWKTYQEINGDWGGTAQLMAMYVKTNDTSLLIGIPAYTYNPTDNRGVCVFFDGNPDVGTNIIESGITSINRISGMGGLSFDTNFAPERVVTFGVQPANAENPGECYVDLGIIPSDSNAWIGTISTVDDIFPTSTVTNHGIMAAALMPGPSYILENTNTASEGIEFSIDYDVLNNSSPTVKVMVVAGNLDGSWLNNQTLPPVSSNLNWLSNEAANHHADLVPGNQYLTIILPTFDTNVHFYASASANKSLIFANTEIDFISSQTGGTPPINYSWDLGNGVQTNVDIFSYTYPAAGNFTPQAIISDSVGNSETVTLAEIKVYASTFVDGLNILNDFAGKGTNALQDTESNWAVATVPGTGAQLEQIFAYCENDKLFIGVSGNMTTGTGDRVLGLFIDSDYNVGSNVMPEVTAGSPAKLQNLAGMTFDSDFTPDKAILLSINSPADCWVNVYHIDSNSDWYWGNKTEKTDIFNPFQRIVNERDGLAGDIVAFNDLNTATSPENATTGIECALDAETIYFGLAPAQDTLRVQAIIYDWNTTNVANQSLPGIDGDSSGFGVASNVNYEVVSGKQYIEVCAPIPEPGIIWIIGLLNFWIIVRKK